MEKEAKTTDSSHTWQCIICVLSFSSRNEFQCHLQSDEHRTKYLTRNYRINRETYVKDKEGVCVLVEDSVEVDFQAREGVISMTPGWNGTEITFLILYSGKDPVYFVGVDLLHKVQLIQNHVSFRLSDRQNVTLREKVVRLKLGSRYSVQCKIGPCTELSRSLHLPVSFEFAFASDVMKTFYIVKTVEIHGEGPLTRDFGQYVRGIKLDMQSKKDELRVVRRLPQYEFTPLFQTLAYNNKAGPLRQHMKITKSLTQENYSGYLHTLLWLEELQQELDIQYYNMSHVRLIRVPNTRYLELQVEGLAENRPSLLPNDSVFVQCESKVSCAVREWQWYEGRVHQVLHSSVYLAFHPRILGVLYNTDTFRVEFVVHRLPMMVVHRAVDMAWKYQSAFLFPKIPDALLPSLPSLVFYNKSLECNSEQVQAVRHIVARTSDTALYLIFGPPGTGKTVTVVEAILQILFICSDAQVLAAAPSNSAADLIAEKLLNYLDERHIIRLNAKTRPMGAFTAMSKKLHRVCNCEDGLVYYPSLEKILEKKVVVTTLITAGRLCSAVGENVPGIFTHCFLDEVGHAMEPEALVAFGGVLKQNGQLVLAGDPHQLGPVVRNVVALTGSHLFPTSGLDISFLERLMKMDIYQPSNDGYDPKVVTKLLKNYRSHKDILEVPNKLFYQSALKFAGDPSIVNAMCSWSQLPKQEFPVIFHGVEGREETTKRSPSFHNEAELAVVLSYVKHLIHDGVAAQDIGVISPYRLQVEKIRKAFADHHSISGRIKVGPVEDFQGEERKVILVSTVRATKEHLMKDEAFRLGFLRNPKRFNVAVTRAKALLIVVGSPSILQLDKNWKAFLEYVKENGGYIGTKYEPPLESVESVIAELEAVSLKPQIRQGLAERVVDAPSWGTSQ